MANSAYVVNVTADQFPAMVLAASYRQPVLVDFWADWCAPCRMLGPVLDKLADSFGGKLLVAKVDTEADKELAMQFNVRSLPTVKLFKNGEVVDEFMGALPEAEIRAFLDPHVERESDALAVQAESMLAAGDAAGALGLLEQARQGDPDNARLPLLMARIRVEQGDFAEAGALLDALPLDRQDSTEIRNLRASLSFERALSEAPDENRLRDRLAADPNDSEARYHLGLQLTKKGDYAEALEQLLLLLKKDRQYNDGAARKSMVDIFELLGNQGELVTRYRAKMMSVLF